MVKSLRNRVIVTALGAVAITSTFVIFLLAAIIGPTLRQRQFDDMRNVLADAAELQGVVDPDQLALLITKPGMTVVITQSEQGSLPAVHSINDIVIRDVHTEANNVLMLEAWLPHSNAAISISSVDVEIYGMVEMIVIVGIPSLLLSMLVVSMALRRATEIALRPLDDMTQLATKIATGEGSGRLEVSDPNTELGRTAVAFDKMLDSLENSVTRARKAEARLRQLCADVAHELRSPLASIVASADNLMRSADKKGTQQLAESTALSVVREGQRAARIVGDLTLAAQLDVDELAERQLVLQPCDLVEVVRNSASTFADRSAVEVKIQDSVGDKVLLGQADPERLQQILTNLLENANRHAKRYLRVDISTNKAQTELQVDVIDDGPGVPKDMHEIIFDRFVRIERDRARNSGGSGLGLHISRALAEAHGGTLKSLPATKGAHFELRIPVRPATN